MTHDELRKAVYDALEAFMENADVPQSQAKSELRDMRDEIESMMGSLDGDDE